MTIHDLNLRIEYVAVSSLKAARRNARTHSAKQIKQIAKSIGEFGFTNPVLVDNDRVIVAGHGRVAAARQLGMEKVPVVSLSSLTPAQLRALAIADNRLAELAGWDAELLRLEFEELMEFRLEFDLTSTGYSMGEIDAFLLPTSPAEEEPAPPPPSGPAVTVPGDLWIAGNHRLLCGNALDAEAYVRLLEGAQADLVFDDPPYNVPVHGHVSGLGKTRHAEFAMASGEMSPAQFTAFLQRVFEHQVRNSRDGSIHYHCIDWRHVGEMLAAGRAEYAEVKNICVWAKTNAGMGSLYRSQHELVLVFKNGRAPHINNVELGQNGRYRSNVWTYAGVNTFGRGRDEDLAAHPTVKPVDLVADAILDCSNRSDLVLDSFCGSGTILLAAERTGRRARAIEIEPRYVDVAIRRWQERTGGAASLAGSGSTFADVAKQREVGPSTAQDPSWLM